MLRELRIQNFKGWEDTGTIRMAPITLLFGANSSGKSSIGQFLMMLKQTAESSDRKAVFHPGGKNSAVQLGAFQDMVFNRDITRKVSFGYTWNLSEPLEILDPTSNKSKKTFIGDRLEFDASVGLEGNDQYSLVLERMEYKLSTAEGADIVKIGMKRSSGQKPDKTEAPIASNTKPKVEYEVEAHGYNLKQKKARAWHPNSSVRFYGFPDEVVANYTNADFVQSLNLQHENLFRSISYLGPLRTKAERLYSWTGIEPDSVGYAGEHTIAAILAAKRRKISFADKQHAKGFEQVIAEKLLEMDLIDRFEVKSISNQRQDYEVKVLTKGSQHWVDLLDVGFGVSQVLPVIVQCFYAPHDSIIIVEQPEVHLHPKAQASLADVLIDAINAREDGREKNIQLIIETHSEHFLRRLQRRIAEDRIAQDKVSAYFANTTPAPAKLNPLQIDQYGKILNWPDNFFGDEMEDITQQSKAALEKRKKELKNMAT